MHVGLFTTLNGSTIPPTTVVVRSAGYSSAGRGQADYAYDATLNAAYVTANPRTAFADSTGRVFKLAEDERTPEMFGAVGDGTSDDSVPLQAFFDDAFNIENAKRFSYNFEGLFAVSQKIYAAYPNDEATRRFRAGRIIVLPRGGLPPIDEVLLIVGPRQVWQGELAVQDGQAANTAYTGRRFDTGIRMMFASQSSFEVIRVDGSKRDALKIDGEQGAWSIRGGTPFALSQPFSRNNIGVRIGSVYMRGGGSYTGVASYGTTQAITQLESGGDSTSGNEVFTTSGSFSNSLWQRSRLTVASTAEMRKYDIGKVRLELVPADYTTITASNSAATLTFASGDPVAKGLVVGDTIYPQSGANAGVAFTILGFSGTSNRTIAVYPAPNNETAHATTKLVTQWSFHQIMNVESATKFVVYPWVPTRSNSPWHLMHGFAVNVVGQDTANIHIDYVSTLLGGGGLGATGLYGTSVNTLLVESAELGILHGLRANSNNIGTKIGHLHLEAVTVNLLQIGGGRLIIEGGSDFHFDRVQTLYVRSAPSDVFEAPRGLVNATIDRGGEFFETDNRGAYSGHQYFQDGSSVTNHPSNRKATVIGDSATVKVDFNDDAARLFGEHHRAEIFWIGAAGAAPTGTLTLSLSAALVAKGWSFGGTTGSVTSAKPCRLELRFHKPAKKVLVARFDAA